MTDQKPRPKRAPDVSKRQQPDGQLILEREDQLVILNQLGAVVWELLDGSFCVESIVQLLHERFEEVAQEQIAEDVSKLVSDLKLAHFVAPEAID